MNIRPTKRQKNIVIDSNMESENKTHNAGECSFASIDEWIEDNISWKLERFTGVSGSYIIIECNNLQSVSEIVIFGKEFFKLVTTQICITNRMTNYIKSMIQFLNGLTVTSSDMKKFLGLIILMGQIKSHWKEYQ